MKLIGSLYSIPLDLDSELGQEEDRNVLSTDQKTFEGNVLLIIQRTVGVGVEQSFLS